MGRWGTANVDTNALLNMTSTVAGRPRSSGTDTVPQCYDDVAAAAVGGPAIILLPRRKLGVANAPARIPTPGGSSDAFLAQRAV